MKHAPNGLAASAIEHLRRHSAAESILPTAARFLEIQQDLGRLAPAGLLCDCPIVRMESGTLVIAVRNAGLASKLRQTLPRLVAGLTRRGWKINAIQLRVQPVRNHAYSGTYPRRRAAAGISTGGLAAWQGLADRLEESPLKDAVARLVAKHGTS